MNGEALQQAIYSKLSGDAELMAMIRGVYAVVDQADDSGSDAAFPYVTIGRDSIVPWDTKTSFGAEAICQIDVWSRAGNYLEAKGIASAISNALHHQPLTIAGCSHVMTVEQSSAFMKDPDGTTKRGMLLFKVSYVRA